MTVDEANDIIDRLSLAAFRGRSLLPLCVETSNTLSEAWALCDVRYIMYSLAINTGLVGLVDWPYRHCYARRCRACTDQIRTVVPTISWELIMADR